MSYAIVGFGKIGRVCDLEVVAVEFSFFVP